MRIPYTNDLVRLATSAHVTIWGEHLTFRRRDGCNLILDGYSETLRKGGKPLVLDEEHAFMKNIALAELHVRYTSVAKRGAAEIHGNSNRGSMPGARATAPSAYLGSDAIRRRGLGSRETCRDGAICRSGSPPHPTIGHVRRELRSRELHSINGAVAGF